MGDDDHATLMERIVLFGGPQAGFNMNLGEMTLNDKKVI